MTTKEAATVVAAATIDMCVRDSWKVIGNRPNTQRTGHSNLAIRFGKLQTPLPALCWRSAPFQRSRRPPLPAGLTWRYQNVILGPGGRSRPGTGQRWRARAERPRRTTKGSNASALEPFGGARGIRTPDLFHAMEARYQLRHSPVFCSPPLGDSTTLADRRRGAQIKNSAARHTLFLAVGRSPV